MGKRLSAAAVEQYERDGYYFPVRVLSDDEARQQRERLERVERDLGGPLRGIYRIKPHLLLTWLADLVRHPVLLDAVEDVLGPDLLCWNSSFFTKEARSPGFVSWHQDATYWGLSEPDVLTAWVAFRPSTAICASCPAATGRSCRTSTRFTRTTSSLAARRSRWRSTSARPPTSSW